MLHHPVHQLKRSDICDITDAGKISDDSDDDEDPTFIPTSTLCDLSVEEGSSETDGEETMNISTQPGTPIRSKHATPLKTSTPRKRAYGSKVCTSFS